MTDDLRGQVRRLRDEDSMYVVPAGMWPVGRRDDDLDAD